MKWRRTLKNHWLFCVCLCLQLNDAFTLYKKEKAENDKMLNETNDKLQKQLTELRSSHAKLTSQLEFSNKRFSSSVQFCCCVTLSVHGDHFYTVCVCVCQV